MAWEREDDFKKLLSANVKHLTKDGMDSLVSIGVKDMLQVRKLSYRHPPLSTPALQYTYRTTTTNK
jgi:hypothetical protein